MINLLPPERKNQLEREYTFRIGTIYIFFFIFALVISAVALLPTYFFAHEKESTVQAQVSALQTTTQSNEITQIKTDLLSVKERMQSLIVNGEQMPFYQVVDTLASHVTPSIMITNISYTRGDGKTPTSLSLGGTAATREALTSFSQALKDDGLFENVILPVSSLAKDKDIEFHIDITGTF